MRTHYAIVATLLALAVTVRTDAVPSCLEDEVRMYDGTCVALDEIQEAAVDLYLEAVSQEGR